MEIKYWVVFIFITTYLGVALGKIPGLALDRTGIALLGAVAIVVSGGLNIYEAVFAIDIPTILLLYGLMVISAQFRLGGFYTRLALKIVKALERPKVFLLLLMVSAAGLSALLANDIICLAFTPVVTMALVVRRRDPIPFLLALAISSNIGSAATIIGNPQNMLIGQVGNLHFWHFFIWCLPPTVVSLFGAYILICLLFKKRLGTEVPIQETELDESWPPYDRHQSSKGLFAIIVLLIFFFTRIPRELVAVSVAGWLLMSRRMGTKKILGLIDWHLITLFCSLFMLIAAIEKYGIPDDIMDFLKYHGVNLRDGYVLTVVSALLSNITSNVPAVMLLTRFIAQEETISWYVLALSSTFAGNLIVMGSIANLIVIEEARELGIRIGFKEHAIVGIPVTIMSLLFLLIWISI